LKLNAPLWRIKTDDPIFDSDVKVAGHLVPEIALTIRGPVIEDIDIIASRVLRVIRAFKPFS